MFAYWALFGIFGLAAATTNERERRLGAVSWLIGGLLLTLMIGLRRNVGGDWRAYEAIFQHLRLAGFSALDAVDPAYKPLNLLAAYLGFNVWAVNLACAAIFTYGLLRFCRDQPNPVLAVLVGIPYLVIVVAMGYTRQGAALGLVLLALGYYFRDAIGRMSVCLALAVTFHRSAIIVIPLIGLAASRRGWQTFALLVATSAIMYSLFVSSSLDRFVANYLGAHYNSSGAGIRIAMNIVPAMLFLIFRNRFSRIARTSIVDDLFNCVGRRAAVVLYDARHRPQSTAWRFTSFHSSFTSCRGFRSSFPTANAQYRR